MNNTTYIVLDLEATCYDRTDKNIPKGFVNEIIEIGAVKCNSEGDVIDEFQIFIKPTKFPVISKFCNELTTIKQKDIDNAVNFTEAFQQFIEWVTSTNTNILEKLKDVMFVSWGHYDKKQFINDSKLNNFDKEWLNWINDSNHISLKHKHAEWNLIQPKGVGLGRACSMEGITFEGVAHRGIDDAKMVAKIFKKYINKING